ncbi:glycosyltransferase family 2 protein [Ruegeria jejuensis]|uniref:glycosyltransferase family 2 protein n=1 Tax=Ruegeria jejuensis TaxID=3233338 RepID=UPI00355C53E9
MLHDQNPAETEATATGLVSVIVSAEGDGKGLADLLTAYRTVLDARPQSYEMIIVFEHASAGIRAALEPLGAQWPNLRLFPQRPWNGEDAAIKQGIGLAVGDIVLTLPCWPEIDPGSIISLIDAVGPADMAVGRRGELNRSSMQKVRAQATHGLLNLLFQQKFEDVFCRARAGRRDVFLRVAELGVRQHFLPLIAASEGYDVQEVDLPVVKDVDAQQIYKFKPNAHVGALVDVLTLFVGLKYLRRPLRFFGSVGVPLILIGALLTAYLVIERLFFGAPLADRPALVFAVLMLVLGIQIVALGLVGEIIIFSSSRRLRSYEIGEVLRGRPSTAPGSEPEAVRDAEAPPQDDHQKSDIRSDVADA